MWNDDTYPVDGEQNVFDDFDDSIEILEKALLEEKRHA